MDISQSHFMKFYKKTCLHVNYAGYDGRILKYQSSPKPDRRTDRIAMAID